VLHVNENDNTLHVLDMLQAYRREFDAKNQIFKDNPLKDYTSDSTDMMRYASLSYDASLLLPEMRRQQFRAKRAIGR
jgi:hypothetical protein